MSILQDMEKLIENKVKELSAAPILAKIDKIVIQDQIMLFTQE